MTYLQAAPTATPLGVQIAPWTSAAEIHVASATLAKAFDVVWVPDQLLARNVYVLLSAIAASGHIGVASGVTIPLARNPIEMASAMATISELLPPQRPMLMGMGAGGPLMASLFSKRSATELLTESVKLIKRLWAGESVTLRDYPVLGARLNWRRDASVRLTYAPARPIPILVAVGGPKTLALAYEVADGLVCTSTFPPLSYAALQSGEHSVAAEIIDLVARREQEGRPLRLVYGLNCCVSRDRGAALAFARRQAALVVGNPALWDRLGSVDFDLESAQAVWQAFERGEGVAAAGRRLSDSLLNSLIVSGTPEECVQRLTEVSTLAAAAGFTEFYLGAPLGPDLSEAAELLVDAVVPQVWPPRG